MSRQNSIDRVTGPTELRAHKWEITAIAAGLVIGATFIHWLPMAAVRLAAVGVIAAQAWLEIGTARKLFVTSPAFLLAGICILFYSVLPATLVPDSIALEPIFAGYVGSQAERYVIVFAMASLLAHLFVRRRLDDGRDQQAIPSWFNPYITNLFIVASLSLTAVDIVYPLAYSRDATYLGPVRSLIPPLQAFLVVYLLRRAIIGSQGLRILVGLVVVAAVVGLLAVNERKIPIFIATAGALYWFRYRDISIKRALIGGLVCAAAGIGMIQAGQAIRTPLASVLQPESFGKSSSFMFWLVLESKFVLRQTDTGNCFRNVIKAHWNEPLIASNQLFWLKGLVPRILWPEKPSLSLGRDYSTRYCGFQEMNVHSSSITLLGQPVIQGGWMGLILHGGLLLVALGGLTWFSRNPGSLSSTTIVALLPWLIDFDQDFAMYAANAVKFFLVMLPMVLIAGLSENNETAWRLASKIGFKMP